MSNATVVNRKITLIKRPDGLPAVSDFELVEEPLGELPPDHVRVAVDTLSIDAFIRTTLDQRDDSLHGVASLGTPVVALGVGQVTASTSAALAVGDWVSGPLMAQTQAQLPAAMLNKIAIRNNVPPRAYLGALGLTTGITAWVGMVSVGAVAEGQTVVVSGAAGAVGTVASQIAKARGARVIGIAGGPEKCAFLTDELGLDDAIDYKGEPVRERLHALANNGIDLFFDNVGGEILDDVLDNLAVGGTIVICGAISQYQHMADIRGPALYLRLAERNAAMRGFTVDHYAGDFETAGREISELITSDQLRLPEHIVQGIEHFPEALITLFTGGHTGKLLVTP